MNITTNTPAVPEPTDEPVQTPPADAPVCAQILLAEHHDETQGPSLIVEMRSTHPDADESPINQVCAYLAVHWHEMVQAALSWARETAHAVDVEDAPVKLAEPAPKIIGVSDKPGTIHVAKELP